MTYSRPLPLKGSAALLNLLSCTTGVACAAVCAAANPELQTLVAAEHAFADAARESVRQAFLDTLADDAWVLQPGPTPGKAWYASHPEGPGSLAWYPHVADVAPSGDLGFTSGPYTYTRGAARAFGQFLTLWRLGTDCRWRVVFDGGRPRATAGIDSRRFFDAIGERRAQRAAGGGGQCVPGRCRAGGPERGAADVCTQRHLFAAARRRAANGSGPRRTAAAEADR